MHHIHVARLLIALSINMNNLISKVQGINNFFYHQRASEDIHEYYGEDYASFQATWTYLITHHRMCNYNYGGAPEDAPVNTPTHQTD